MQKPTSVHSALSTSTLPTSLTYSDTQRMLQESQPMDLKGSHEFMPCAAACLGVIGAVGAFVALQRIGKRAHSLVSINYLFLMTLVISGTTFLFGWIGFAWPNAFLYWCYLTLIGVFGFFAQLSTTEGFRDEDSSSATSMLYLQLVWALLIDLVVQGRSRRCRSSLVQS